MIFLRIVGWWHWKNEHLWREIWWWKLQSQAYSSWIIVYGKSPSFLYIYYKSNHEYLYLIYSRNLRFVIRTKEWITNKIIMSETINQWKKYSNIVICRQTVEQTQMDVKYDHFMFRMAVFLTFVAVFYFMCPRWVAGWQACCVWICHWWAQNNPHHWKCFRRPPKQTQNPLYH